MQTTKRSSPWKSKEVHWINCNPDLEATMEKPKKGYCSKHVTKKRPSKKKL